MIMHTVLFRWERAPREDELASVRDGLERLRALPCVRHMEYGSDLGLRPQTYDFVMVAWFDDVDAYDHYSRHPVHSAFVNDVLDPLGATRASAQIDVATLP